VTRTVVLYGRPGCHLCEEALEQLERLRAELAFALEERDIEQDDRLHREYLERIPVIALDGEELFDFFVDEDELRRRLAA
jgi:glutaredoxin